MLVKRKGLTATGDSDLVCLCRGSWAEESCYVSKGHAIQDPKTRAALWGTQLQEDHNRVCWLSGQPQPCWHPLISAANFQALHHGLSCHFILLVIIMVNKTRPNA